MTLCIVVRFDGSLADSAIIGIEQLAAKTAILTKRLPVSGAQLAPTLVDQNRS